MKVGNRVVVGGGEKCLDFWCILKVELRLNVDWLSVWYKRKIVFRNDIKILVWVGGRIEVLLIII